MPVYQAEALILRTYKLGEADRIVVFLTRDRGKKRGVAKGARRQKSRYTGALEPMTRAGVAYYEREQRDLVRLNFVEPTRSPLSSASGEALGYVGYFAELIDEWAPEAHADERLYRLGSSIVDGLAADAPIEALCRYFEYWLLRLQGVYPSIRRCGECGAPLADGASMSHGDSTLLCRQCAASRAGTSLSAEAMAFLTGAATIAPGDLSSMPLGPRAGRELESAHRRLISAHLEKELKSARVLREMRQARMGR
jgi:DNA repair protein RecO (recombination protein O)